VRGPEANVSRGLLARRCRIRGPSLHRKSERGAIIRRVHESGQAGAARDNGRRGEGRRVEARGVEGHLEGEQARDEGGGAESALDPTAARAGRRLRLQRPHGGRRNISPGNGCDAKLISRPLRVIWST